MNNLDQIKDRISDLSDVHKAQLQKEIEWAYEAGKRASLVDSVYELIQAIDLHKRGIVKRLKAMEDEQR